MQRQYVKRPPCRAARGSYRLSGDLRCCCCAFQSVAHAQRGRRELPALAVPFARASSLMPFNMGGPHGLPRSWTSCRHSRAKAKVTPLPRSGEVNLRARRLGTTAGERHQLHLPGADQLALAQIAQRSLQGAQLQEAPLQGARSREPAASCRRRRDSRPGSRRRRGRALRPLRRSPASPRGTRTLIGVLRA